MTDKNNRPMKTGDVVEITGAYFKNDNGLYFVEHTPGDPNWSGRDHCLRRIKRNGELSTAKDNLCFWPISAFVNSRDKRAAANQWNREHAEIEIKTFPHTEHIAKFFAAEADSLDATIKRYTWDFGEDCQTVKDTKETQAFYRSVADGLRAEQPTADLEAENASRRAEQEAEQAERETVLRRRVAGRCFIAETEQAHPITPGAPFVEIPFSENPAFYACTDQAGKTGEPLRLSVAAAEIIIRHYDAEVYADPDSAYDKTDFVIHYTDEHGQPSTYSGRYDLGCDAGGLVSHIRNFGENLRSMGHLWNSQPTEQDEADAAAILALADLLTAEINPTTPTPPTGGKVVTVDFTQNSAATVQPSAATQQPEQTQQPDFLDWDPAEVKAELERRNAENDHSFVAGVLSDVEHLAPEQQTPATGAGVEAPAEQPEATTAEQAEQAEQPTPENRPETVPPYGSIDEETARNAHYCVHMSDYKPGSATASYRNAVNSAAKMVEQQKARVSAFYHDKLDALLNSYARRLAQWTNDYNRNQSSYPSQFIAGAGNFNMRKHNRQMSREDSLWEEYRQIEAILDKIRSVGTGPVDLADPHAREMLTERLNSQRQMLEDAKTANAYYRKHKTLEGCPGLSEKNRAWLTRPGVFASGDGSPISQYGSPFPAYELASIRGKIERTEQRLAELDRREQQAAEPQTGTAFDGGQIVRNIDLNRLQILFDAIPSADTRAAMKQNGFRWSPKNQAWQRQLTDNAERAARQVLRLA